MKNYWQAVSLILLISIIGVGISIWQPWKITNRTIQTSGEGKVMAAPDIARITGGVEIKKATADEAQTAASNTIASITTAIKEKGIEEKDIKTENIYTNPNYNYSNGKQENDGYISRATITITVRDIKKGQEIADLITKNGGTNIYGPNLGFSDEKMEDLKNQAREKAIVNAREKADQIASSTNVRVLKVSNIVESEASGSGSVPYRTTGVAEDTKLSTPTSSIQPGESEVTINISATFSIK